MSKNKWAKAAQSLMRQKGVKQKDLIELFDVSTQGAVSHYFSGRYEATHQQLKKLAQRLDVEENYFIDLQEASPERHLDANLLTESLQTLARIDSMSERDIIKFFTIYEKMNADRIAEVYEALLKAKQQKEDLINSAAIRMSKSSSK